ncbi:MAG: class I SAM-dependent methyltransferase [Acidobacteria bacterium]|nr:class I SAM-dependent methyltransferase [Acidobacteriota bacterium]
MSETFDPAWLALREPVDHRSRAAAAASLLATACRRHGWSRVVDLGSGTGSNLRYLAPRLPGPQHWTLVDRDADLLGRASAPEGVERLRCLTADLADSGLAAIADSDAHVVTGSALLDLVSRTWLERLVDRCRQAGCAAHFALTYDGSAQWHGAADDPRADDDPDDGPVRRAVNAHQRRDKGFGPALGPMAGLTAETAFRGAGYRVWSMRSPWRLGPRDARLARALVDGWEAAALELAEGGEAGRSPSGDDPTGPDPAAIRSWGGRRRATIDSGRFGLTVGHLDLLALPPPATR